MQETKVQFSIAEIELMCNTEIILTKNKAIEKVKQLLQGVQDQMLFYYKENQAVLPGDIFSIHPKISKGENYLGLPYLILDYPRCFQQQQIFTIRTMFWWGNFYSTTLHMAGTFKKEFVEKIEKAFQLLAQGNYYIGMSSEPWAHHFGADNYKKISLLSKEEFEIICQRQEHLKIATNTSINNPQLQDNLVNSWKELVSVCFA